MPSYTVTDAPSSHISQPDFSHNQPRLRRPKRSARQKQSDEFSAMEKLLKDSPFKTIGHFLSILFFNPIRGERDPRGTKHSRVVARFLRGRTNIKMSHILPLIYRHKASFPTSKSVDVLEQKEMFATAGPVDQSNHARPYMSTWAVRLVAVEARKQVVHDNPDDVDGRVQLRAQTNGRTAAHVVSWDELLCHFNLKWLGTKYCIRLPLPWFLTESMSAPKAKGAIFIRKRRPHPTIQVGAIASFVLSRNRYANADLAMVLGVWLFACKSHIDVKRVFSRFGYTVSDTTARNALNSMTIRSLEDLRADVKDATDRGETEHCLLLDNVQQHCDVYEQGIGRKSELKVRTAGTSVKLQDCAPGAFDAEPYHAKVAQQERKTLTTDLLFDDINWTHMRVAIPLHWTRALVEFEPEFQPFLKELSSMFHDELAIHRMQEGRQHKCQPVGTNGERSTETQGMERAIGDFDAQTGTDSTKGNRLDWLRGDGASYAAFLRLTKYCTPIGKFPNKIATPEIWHTGATDLNSTAANHYGPASSSDPSSLSKCSNITGFKRPSNPKSCDYYPTVRNLTAFWTAHVLDCWRVHFETDDLHTYFHDLAKLGELPDLATLLGEAMVLVDRYATQAAIQISLTKSESLDPSRTNKVPEGSPWVAPTTSNHPMTINDVDLPGLVEIDEAEPPVAPRVAPKVPEDAPKFHQEKSGFTGDRVLRNSQIFMQDFGWWIEFARAVPEGDIGRVWEIMKIWIFKFAGSSHQNYMAYLLEVYCMLRYEASNDLRNAILNNWLLNIKGELGKWIPADLHQEHYNKWLEDMIQKHGGEFDNKFYRQTISPNVHHFLQIKHEVESAFALEHRGQTHTSPSLQGEIHLLLTAFKEEQVHRFRSGRSMGHAAVNQFARGWRRLEEDKMADFLYKTTVVGDFLTEIRRKENQTTEGNGTTDEDIEMRSDSPAPSIPESDPGSDCPSENLSIRSQHSSSSGDSYRSYISDVIDPNEPEDDGEDLSNAQLRSGSFSTLSVDPETGIMGIENEAEGDDEYDGEKDETIREEEDEMEREEVDQTDPEEEEDEMVEEEEEDGELEPDSGEDVSDSEADN
ncbi:hypothetical protein DFH07DRAFT_742456 [Mycena maculata]|uniref:DUF6589 domain-containing protein n=1 Tax=Mycena maculata TaxID=230809 RepID=A0AAD7J6M4_9AGAR|nr:hypothetical protein DFH07DRAFT_742456 [Mycena maculata]